MINQPYQQLIIGIILAGLVVAAARRLKTLSNSGALAAFILGIIFFGLGGLKWAVLLLGFFISSSAMSRLFKRRKINLDEKFSKSSQRDAGQVLANGGIAGIFVLLGMAFPEAAWPWLACTGSLAAVNADTWATELGVLNRSDPRLITSLRVVDPGTSGGVSILGTLAALAGGGFIAGLAVLMSAPPDWIQTGLLITWIALAGLAGSLVDSLLGATLQAIYYCPACCKETERHPAHTCGNLTTFHKGLPWMNNDLVNTACAASGAGLGILFLVF